MILTSLIPLHTVDATGRCDQNRRIAALLAVAPSRRDSSKFGDAVRAAYDNTYRNLVTYFRRKEEIVGSNPAVLTSFK